MLIAIDIGNSRIKAGVFINKILYKTFDSLSESELIKLVNEYPDFAVYVCAVSKIPPHFLNLIVNKHRLVQVSYLTNIPLKINYHTPDKLGIDRLVGSVGAWSIFTGKNILIVDIGTCVTYDFVSENGYYLGGAISPGLLIRAKALNSFTEKLPLVNINLEEPNLIGNSTEACIKEVSDSQGEIILFIDEIHTLIGAGAGGDSAMDAANLLKPALARGELHTIGATTLKEYQKYIEKDKALERRFQTVFVDEPDVSDAISILRGIKDKYELHHGVRIKDEAIIAAVELSHRYITDRFLPDKAIDLMDEAASKLRIEIDSLPEELDELERKIMQLEIEREALKREQDEQKINEISKEIAELNEKRNSLRAKWQSEKEIILAIKQKKQEIENLKLEAEKYERLGEYGKVAEIRYGKIRDAENLLQNLQGQFKSIQGENSLLKEEVTAEDIAEVVARWTGIPVTKMLQSEREKLVHLEDELKKRVAGQEEAIQAVADAVRRSRAGLQDPKKPIGTFIFLGTTGVGKTELAKALADFLFNDENAMIRIDMSEYQERHSVSRLVGAPPGYVGYDEGGQLTEAVRRRPYAVILLDEIEKAHPDVFNILLQVLDDGRLTDNKGRVANFKNTIIIMTSNIGAYIIQEKFENFEHFDIFKQLDIIDETKELVIAELKKTVRPEFINRIDEIIMFKPLTKPIVREIVKMQFEQVKKRVKDSGYELEFTDEVLNFIAEKGFDPQYGARPLKRVIQKLLLNELSKAILSNKIKKDSKILVTLNQDVLEFNQLHDPSFTTVI